MPSSTPDSPPSRPCAACSSGGGPAAELSPRWAGGQPRSLEDDSPAPVDDHAVLGVPADRVREGPGLGLPAPGGELFRRRRVVDAEHLLLDDRALVQICGDVVRGRTDELDPA